VLCVACVRRCAWSDVTSVCILLFDRCERQWARSDLALLCCCVAVRVALLFIGRSLRLSAVEVAPQRWRYAGVREAAIVLSHDTSGCSCSLVASPPPSDAVPWLLWLLLSLSSLSSLLLVLACAC
jgi:hypothetical protein